MGVQIKSALYGGRSRTRFIDERNIKEIIINEGLLGFEFRFYLAIVLYDQDEMVVVFEVC